MDLYLLTISQLLGDGTTTVDKSKLKDEYVDHMSQIQAMTKKIVSQTLF